MWTKSNGKKPQLDIFKLNDKTKDLDALERKIERATQKEGSRYSLSWYDQASYDVYKKGKITWDKVEGHAVSMERLKGKLLIHDESKNVYCKLSQLFTIAELNDKGIELLRLDRLHINDKNKYITKIVALSI